jgi:hypothetical protein
VSIGISLVNVRLLYFSAGAARDVSDVKGRGPSRAWSFAKDIILVTLVLAIASGLALAVTLMSHPTAQSAESAIDFSLDIRPLSGSVGRGSAATTIVTATATSASVRDIWFSCLDAPSGTACSFTPTSCRPTCSPELLFVTSASAPTGTHVVTVAASDGTVSRTRTFSVTISDISPPSVFDFSIDVNPGSGSVSSGGTVATNVKANLSSGSPHAVQLSCSSLPTGTTCTFLPPSCSPTCEANLSLSTSAHTPPGTYAIHVTASDGLVSKTAVYSLAVQPSSVTTLTFQKGDGGPYSETDDTTLHNGTPDTNFGADLTFSADGETCMANLTVCRGLLSFPNFLGPNTGQVPENATILSAILDLNVTNDGPDQKLYQVSESWSEANATWNSFVVPGKPRTKGPTSFFNTTLGWNVVNITGIVQNWVDGDANLGIFLRCDFWNGSYYSSSESIDPPKLTVTFWSPPPALRQATDPSAGPPGPSGSRHVPSLFPPFVSSDSNRLARDEMRPLSPRSDSVRRQLTPD